MAPNQAERALELLWNLEQLEDLTELMQLTTYGVGDATTRANIRSNVVLERT